MLKIVSFRGIWPIAVSWGWQRLSISTVRPPSSSFFPDGDGHQLAFPSWLFHEEVLRTELPAIHQELWFTSCLSEHYSVVFIGAVDRKRKINRKSPISRIFHLDLDPAGSPVRLEHLLCITRTPLYILAFKVKGNHTFNKGADQIAPWSIPFLLILNCLCIKGRVQMVIMTYPKPCQEISKQNIDNFSLVF